MVRASTGVMSLTWPPSERTAGRAMEAAAMTTFRPLLLVLVSAWLGGVAFGQGAKAKRRTVLDEKGELPERAVARLGRLNLYHKQALAAFFTPDSKRIVPLGPDNVVRYWSVAEGKEVG